MEKVLYQVRLRDGDTELTCWVDKKVVPGNRITLKNSEAPDRWWQVEWVSVPMMSRHVKDKRWQVGGL